MDVTRRSVRVIGATGFALAAVAVAGAKGLIGADHIDAPITTADADADINDQFVFTSPADPSRVVFALTMHPLVAPTEAATVRFPTDILYEWKIDTDGDAVEDRVIQAEIVAGEQGQQVFRVYGPDAPITTGTQSMILRSDPLITGRVSDATETHVIEQRGIRAFAGVRDDPFFIDLTRLLEVLGGQATSFRDPGVDTIEGLNTLAIVVELPISMIGAEQFGVWATSSRANR